MNIPSLSREAMMLPRSLTLPTGEIITF